MKKRLLNIKDATVVDVKVINEGCNDEAVRLVFDNRYELEIPYKVENLILLDQKTRG